MLAITGGIALVGMAITTTFSIALMTNFYTEMKKKKLGLF